MIQVFLFWLAAYLIGSVNFSIFLFRFLGKGDPRNSFSGTAGAFNVSRQLGKPWAAFILLLDMARALGIAAITLYWFTPAHLPASAMALIAGNHFPIFHGFRGGKGVATYLGFTLFVCPWAVPASMVAWVIAYKLGGEAFIGSFFMVAVLTIGNLLAVGDHALAMIGFFILFAFLCFTHRSNFATWFETKALENLQRPKKSFQPVHGAAGSTIVATILFLILNPPVAWVPLTAFILICLVAPFFPTWQFFFPIINRGPADEPKVALTFDDGPDPATTGRLLDMLESSHTKATFFVVGKKAKEHPDLISRMIDQGHEIGNHSFSHDVFLMLRGSKAISEEIRQCQEVLEEMNCAPKFFRPPVGITAPPLGPILKELELTCVCFRNRSPDRGNRKIQGPVKSNLADHNPGDILVAHDSKPRGRATVDQWLLEIEALIFSLKEKGFQIVSLKELLRLENPSKADSIQSK